MCEAIGYTVKMNEQNKQYAFIFLHNGIEKDFILLTRNEVLQIKRLIQDIT